MTGSGAEEHEGELRQVLAAMLKMMSNAEERPINGVAFDLLREGKRRERERASRIDLNLVWLG